MEVIQELLSGGGYFFFFDMGTLLGVIREHCLLKHDLDIDVGLRIENESDIERVQSLLRKNGCIQQFSYVIEGIGIVEDSFRYAEIKFDICYYRKEKDVDICYLMYTKPECLTAEKIGDQEIESVVRLECPTILEITQIPFGKGLINIPSQAEKYLQCRYGADWRTPDLGYVYWKGPSARKVDLIGLKYTFSLPES